MLLFKKFTWIKIRLNEMAMEFPFGDVRVIILKSVVQCCHSLLTKGNVLSRYLTLRNVMFLSNLNDYNGLRPLVCLCRSTKKSLNY